MEITAMNTEALLARIELALYRVRDAARAEPEMDANRVIEHEMFFLKESLKQMLGDKN
jgi:hypothetical protein